MTINFKKALNTIENSNFGEMIAELFAGKTVEIYLGEKSGSTFYSDHDIEQKIFVTGKILGAKADLLLVECEIMTPTKLFHIPMAINSWSITGVIEHVPGQPNISCIFQEIRR